MNKYFLFFSIAMTQTACLGSVNNCDLESDSETEESSPPATTGSSALECPVVVDVLNCPVTYHDCEGTLNKVHFITHASHDCKVADYPPKYCQYMGDVSCNDQIAGVWCCEY